MVAIDRLQAVPHRVYALGDRLITIVVPFGRELQHTDKLSVGQERKKDRSLGSRRFLRDRDRLPQPDVGDRTTLVVLKSKSLSTQAVADRCG